MEALGDRRLTTNDWRPTTAVPSVLLQRYFGVDLTLGDTVPDIVFEAVHHEQVSQSQ
jgi:hypothetical protein